MNWTLHRGVLYLCDILYMSVHRQNENADMEMPYMKSNGTTETPQWQQLKVRTLKQIKAIQLDRNILQQDTFLVLVAV